ncbi:hypothetical protein ACTVCO_06650 [Sanguibacter sp. A247]|uniref:hypothetical protein n=1 Tax=unclassified Sanguibacter TaxID=2645534 RepID=UPI003FD7D0B1
MLGRSERESGAHALAAARQGGWDSHENLDEPTDLLDLGSMSAALATVSRIDGLRGVMHVGHPAAPDHDLERSLLASAAPLRVTAVEAVASRWVWVARGTELDGHVVVDEAGMRDCRHQLRTLGANPHLVPARTSLAARIALAGEHGSLVVERDHVPDGFSEVPGSAVLRDHAPLWYGLVEPVAEPADFDEPAQVWLAFGPRDDHRGSLQLTLGLVAAAGIDLQHLRSQPSADGPHVFFASFTVPTSAPLRALKAQLSEQGVTHRVLGVMRGAAFVPGPAAVTPVWAARS